MDMSKLSQIKGENANRSNFVCNLLSIDGHSPHKQWKLPHKQLRGICEIIVDKHHQNMERNTAKSNRHIPNGFFLIFPFT